MKRDQFVARAPATTSGPPQRQPSARAAGPRLVRGARILKCPLSVSPRPVKHSYRAKAQRIIIRVSGFESLSSKKGLQMGTFDPTMDTRIIPRFRREIWL